MTRKWKHEVESHLKRKFKIVKFRWESLKNHAHLRLIFENGEEHKIVISCTPSCNRILKQIAGQVNRFITKIYK